jgi:hypothetical protein
MKESNRRREGPRWGGREKRAAPAATRAAAAMIVSCARVIAGPDKMSLSDCGFFSINPIPIYLGVYK